MDLPKKIALNGYGGIMNFTLTDKREIKYYGKTDTCNQSIMRTEKLDNNEVFYQSEFGWGVFVNSITMKTIGNDGWSNQDISSFQNK